MGNAATIILIWRRRADMTRTVILDCDQGRALGCQSFCCSLIVRLRDGERDPTALDDSRKSCVDKNVDTGRCIHQDPNTGRCGIWNDRPQVCREYDCNTDDSLQIVLQHGFTSIMQLATTAYEAAPRNCVPQIDE